MTAALPMGGQKITGMADPTVATDGATKNYVDSIASFSTGDMKPTLKIVADTGWLMMFDESIGNVGSTGAFQGAAYQALYLLIWNAISNPTGNAFAPVSGGLGVSAAADWAGLKSLILPKTLGRVLGNSGNGGTTGLTSRALGSSFGAETATLVTANLPAYTPAGTNGSSAANVNSPGNVVTGTVALPLTAQTGSGTGAATGTGFASGVVASSGTASAQTFAGTAQGGSSTAFSIMQPTGFVNWMIKL